MSHKAGHAGKNLSRIYKGLTETAQLSAVCSGTYLSFELGGCISLWNYLPYTSAPLAGGNHVLRNVWNTQSTGRLYKLS